MAVPDPSPAARPPRRRSSLRRRVLFMLVPTLTLVGVGELGVRLRRGKVFSLGDARSDRMKMFQAAYPARHDPALGHVPRPGRGRDNAWGTQVSIDDATLRENGGPPPPGPPLVAVGDSFTFGDQVDDDASWPAALERRLGRRVLNGGVFAYGFDQAALRAEALLERHPEASALLLGLIADDIRRCEQTRHGGVWKPYFDVVDGRLALRGVPVPTPPEGEVPLLARSHLADALLDRLAPRWWGSSGSRLVVHDRGLEVCCALLEERLVPWATRRPTLLIAQGPVASGWREQLRRLVERAQALGLPVLDLVSEQEARFAADPSLEARWFDGHMTAEGNAWVAERVAEELRRRWPERFTAPPR